MGSVLMASVVLILGNLIADILLAIADPRISYD
jgi:peptide/nickel transport system permease protein